MHALQAPNLSSAARVADPPVHIGVYDGPLELLLFLVRREGVDVRDIPVARICDSYLSYLDQADEIDVDQAGDYLVMAATLCQLKARELLPRSAEAKEEEEEIDPREALARRLLEYERFRDAAEELGRRERLDRDVFARPAEPPAPDEQHIDPGMDSFGLLRLFYAVAERAARPPHQHRIVRERFRFADTVRWILGRLLPGEETLLSELMMDMGTRARRIFTFLGVLEMARLQLVDVVQHIHLGAIRVTGKVSLEEADLSALPVEEPDEDAEEDALG
ncbi:MAG: segregation/condensation protein A [Pseudomonadota bacterium]|nr:segregation/condensation protein A [Pseudomonadota bacterium]